MISAGGYAGADRAWWSGQSAFVINQRQAARSCVAPSPEYQVEIIISGGRSKTSDQEAVIAVGRKFARKGLCFGFSACLHFITPAGRGYRSAIYSLLLKGDFVPAVEDVLDISFVTDERCRLQAAHLIGFPERSQN